MARYGSAWEEIGRIDFLLDDLARAVERGEIPRDSYDAIAPRHLARRAELVAEIEGAREAWNRPPPGQPAAASAPAPATRARPGVAPPPSGAAEAGVELAIAPRPHREVRWTQVLAYTGAFLVVVAAAIFTVAVWEAVSTTAKLAFLGVFTAAFYGAGVWVWRAGLRGGGVALTAVGSTMLLFDGWIAIDGYGLAGPWPWAALLLVLSAVYWFTETRLTGRFFGATGAAAQVGWWWLLGQGLGWTVAPRLAGIAAVAAAWAFVAEAVRDREEFASLASVLRLAAPVTLAGAALGVFADLAVGPVRWAEVASAAVVAIALSAVLDRFWTRVRGFAALGWAPLLVATVWLASGDTSWAHVAVFAVAAIALGGYELARGGWGHGVAALVFEVTAWFALANRLSFPDDALLSLLIVVAVTWLVGARLMQGDALEGDPLAPHAAAFAPVVTAGGWLLLVVATLFVPDGLSQAAWDSWALAVPRETVLAAILTLGWACAARLMRAWPAAIVAAAGSFLTLGLLIDGLAPDLHPAYLLSALVALAALWLHLPRVAEGLSAPFMSRVISWVAGGLSVSLMLQYWIAMPDAAGWPVLVLLFAVAGLWLSEAARHRSYPPVAAAIVVLVTGAVFLGDLVEALGRTVGSASGGLLGTGAGVLLSAAALAYSRAVEEGELLWWWALPAAVAASLAALWPTVMLAGPRQAEVAPALAATFALAALAWALCALALRRPWLSAPSALAGWMSLLAVLAWLEVPPSVTVGVLTGYALALFAPTLLTGRPHGADERAAVAPPLALGSLVVASSTVLLGVQSYSGLRLWSGWADLGETGLIVSLVVLGALLVSAARPYAIEVAEYAGTFCLLAAGWVALDAADVGVLEPYLVLLALYIAGSAYRYASRAPHRRVPVASDWAAVVSAAWIPALLAVSARTPADAFTHAVWAVGLSLAAIAAGIVLRVRGYLFGGVVALVFVSVWRSFFLLVEFWWVVLGIIGIAMLAIALTWERQQLLLARTGRMVREYLGGWR